MPDALVETVRRWLQYADTDLAVAHQLLEAPARYPYAIAFHAQQAAHSRHCIQAEGALVSGVPAGMAKWQTQRT